MWPLKVVIVDECGEPALCAGEPAVPSIVKALDAHLQCLESLLDLIGVGVLELAAQICACESDQVAEAVDQQLRC